MTVAAGGGDRRTLRVIAAAAYHHSTVICRTPLLLPQYGHMPLTTTAACQMSRLSEIVNLRVGQASRRLVMPAKAKKP